MYTVYNSIDKSRSSSLFQLINTRHKLARLLGYESAADRTISNSMAGDVNSVKTLLHNSAQLLRPIALGEIAAARDMVISLLDENDKQKTPYALCDRMHVYDGAFYINYARNNIWKQQPSSINSDNSLSLALAEYFPLKNCLEAINIICQSLFKTCFEPLSVRPNETWHSSVIKAGLMDENGLQGVLYLDLMSRADKPDLECHQLIQGSRKDEQGRFQIPVAALSCNFSSLSPNSNQLISPSNLCSFFHEMGHALHSLLGRTNFQHVAGTRCPTDLGEIPSNLMEYFSSDKRFLKLFARHYETDELIPDDLLHFLVQRACSFEAYSTYIQVLYAIMDIMLHVREFESENEMLQLENEVYNEYGLYLPESNTSWMQRFSHLSSYGSRYYSYTWAKAFASLFWKRKFLKDPLSPLIGEQYKDLFLSRGYGMDPWDMVHEFLGFKPTTNDLVKSILHSVKEDRTNEQESGCSSQDYELKWQNLIH